MSAGRLKPGRRQTYVETDGDWRAERWWCDDDGGTRNAIRQRSCGLRANVLSARRTARRNRDWAAPAVDSDPAVERTPGPAEGSEACCPCRARGAGLRNVTRPPDSTPRLRRTAVLGGALSRRWPRRAPCRSWTKSAPPHRPTAGRSGAWLP